VRIKENLVFFFSHLKRNQDRNIHQESLIMCIFLPGRGGDHFILDTMPNLIQRKSALPAFLSFENNKCFELQISPNCRGIRDLTQVTW